MRIMPDVKPINLKGRHRITTTVPGTPRVVSSTEQLETVANGTLVDGEQERVGSSQMSVTEGTIEKSSNKLLVTAENFLAI